MSERDWTAGHRAAWLQLLQTALRELGYEGCDAGALAAQRERALAALRGLCAKHGDNDWGDGLDLADVIDKHLARHLRDRS